MLYKKKEKYTCGIIGYPLKNPRSIKIWKKYFKEHKINSDMVAFNIKPRFFLNFLNNIKKKENFLAMAVTMPYKKKIIKFLDNVDNFAEKTNSVNLVLKKQNKLIGFNTDIFGANECFKKIIKNYEKIIIIGIGGTGQAIFNYLFSTYKKKKFILVSKKFKFKSRRVKIIKNLNKKILNKKSFIFNCSPLGSNLKKEYLNRYPIQKSFLKEISKKSFVFDVIYSPKSTIFLKECNNLKIKNMNGLKMNTLQAEQALKIIFK